MSPQSPWIRFFAGIVAAAIAIRLVIDLLRPVLGYLIAAIVIAGLIVLVRWWRSSRW